MEESYVAVGTLWKLRLSVHTWGLDAPTTEHLDKLPEDTFWLKLSGFGWRHRRFEANKSIFSWNGLYQKFSIVGHNVGVWQNVFKTTELFWNRPSTSSLLNWPRLKSVGNQSKSRKGLIGLWISVHSWITENWFDFEFSVNSNWVILDSLTISFAWSMIHLWHLAINRITTPHKITHHKRKQNQRKV